MKGRRYTTEDKLRILREADRGKRILEVCREHNISEVSFHRWKRPFGQMDLSEARKLKELERENGELKKMQSRGVAQEPRAGARAHEPAQRVEEFTQRIIALRGVLLHQGQGGHDEVPLFIGNVARIPEAED